MGAFAGSGSYATSAAGTRDVGFEEDLFGALRLGSHASGRAARRRSSRRRAPWPALSGFGGGLGDITASARFDVSNAGTRGLWPGLAILAGLAVPTGDAPDEADDPLATSGTGTGSYEGNLGRRRRGDHRAGIRVAVRLRLETDRARRRRRRADVRPTAVGGAGRRIHVRARHHRRRVRVGAAAGRRARRERRRSRTAASRWSPRAPRWRCRSGTRGGCRRRCSPTCRSPAGGAIRRSGSAARSPSSASGSERVGSRRALLAAYHRGRVWDARGHPPHRHPPRVPILRGSGPSRSSGGSWAPARRVGGLSSSTFQMTNETILSLSRPGALRVAQHPLDQRLVVGAAVRDVVAVAVEDVAGPQRSRDREAGVRMAAGSRSRCTDRRDVRRP